MHPLMQDKNTVQTGPQLLVVDLLSRHNHHKNKNEEIPGMFITINVMALCTDILDCVRAKEIRLATLDNKHMCLLSEYVLHGWPSTNVEVQKELQPYWSFRNEIAVIDGIVMKGIRIIVPTSPQNKALNHLCLSHMDIDRTRLLACEPI